MSRPVEVSVVLPAYNEERTIERTIETTLETLGEFLPDGSFEVIVAEDGCEDRTPEIAAAFAARDDRVRHFHSDERLGRGGALERAFEEADGDTLVYFDTDLATDMRHLEELVQSVRSGEYDVATGSRWISGHRAERPPKRGVPSRVYNGLVRLFLRSDLRDHQCGFKAFDREAFLELSAEVEDEHWFWDTEMLVLAQRRGYRVEEFPVDWTPKGDTKVDLVRDVFGMGSQIIRTWWQLTVQPRITQRRSIVAGFLLTVLALGLMTLYFDPANVFDALASADLWLIALATLVYLVSWPVRGVRYRDILERVGYPDSATFMTAAVFISQLGNLVFPARAGDAIRAYVVKSRRDIPYPSGFSSLAVERVFDILTITALAGSVLAALAFTGNLEAIVQTVAEGGLEVSDGQELTPTQVSQVLAVTGAVGVAAVLGVIAILVTARWDRNLVRPAMSRLSEDSYASYVASVIERFVGDIQTIANDGEAILKVGVASVVIWLLDVITAVLVLAAFPSVDLSLLALFGVGLFAVSVGNLAKMLPLSPGGIGPYELVFTVFVAGLTPITGAVAFAAALLDHALKNLVTVAGGFVSMAWLNVSLTTAVEEASEVEEEIDADVPEADD